MYVLYIARRCNEFNIEARARVYPQRAGRVDDFLFFSADLYRGLLRLNHCITRLLRSRHIFRVPRARNDSFMRGRSFYPRSDTLDGRINFRRSQSRVVIDESLLHCDATNDSVSSKRDEKNARQISAAKCPARKISLPVITGVAPKWRANGIVAGANSKGSEISSLFVDTGGRINYALTRTHFPARLNISVNGEFSFPALLTPTGAEFQGRSRGPVPRARVSRPRPA